MSTSYGEVIVETIRFAALVIANQPRWLILLTAVVFGSLIVSTALVTGGHWLALPVLAISIFLSFVLRIIAAIRVRLQLERDFPNEEIRDLNWDVLPLLMREPRQ